MPELAELEQAATLVWRWSEERELRQLALRRFKEHLGTTPDLCGVPVKQIRTEFVRQELVFDTEGDGKSPSRPSVRVLYQLELRKQPLGAGSPAFGSFQLQVDLQGAVQLFKVDVDREFLAGVGYGP